MMRSYLAAFLVVLAAGPALAQERAGVATTVEGNVTVARQTIRPAALKFKDDVFLRDTVATGDQSFARLLLGGKAVVSVRERSSLRITEVPGRSTVEIDSGKIGMAVARDRMRPGEVIDIRTPNAVLAVRGTVVVVEVVQATASAADQPGSWTTQVHVLRGSIDALQFDPTTGRPLGSAIPINPNFSYSVTGTGAPRVGPTPPDQVGRITAGLQPKGQQFRGGDSTGQAKGNVVALSTQVINTLVQGGMPTGPSQQIRTDLDNNRDGVVANNENDPNGSSSELGPGGGTTPPPPPPDPGPGPGPGPGDNLLSNPGFNTGNFQGWTLTGAGLVIPAFDGVTGGLAFLHTGEGATPFPKGTPTCPSCRQGTTLTQTFDSPALIRVGGRAVVLSNEFPEFTGGQSQFNDFVAVTVIDAKGTRHTVFQRTVNELNETFVSIGKKSLTIDGFTLVPPGGVAVVGEFGRSMVVEPGEATLELGVFDVSDDRRDTAVIFDSLVVQPDPPLYFVHDRHLDREGALLTMIREQRAVDTILVVCCTGSARLDGPILRATDSVLDAPFSVATIIQGGRVRSGSTGPLVALDGGRYRLGTQVGIFDLGGTRTALDPETGLVLGTEEPLRHAGGFVEARGAAIETASAVRLDTALLEASRPIANLLRGSSMTVTDQFVDVYGGTLLASGPIVRLDASTLSVNGALVRVTGGVFDGAGSLVTLADGSTLRVATLGNVSGGGRFNWSGPLGTFTGADNTLRINNSYCASMECVDVNGVRVALRNGATADNIRVRNNQLFVGDGPNGHVRLGRDAAHFVVSGPNSRVRLR